MQKSNVRAQHLRAILKEQLKKNSLTYTDAANAAGVSLPTIKRWLTRGDIPVTALDLILVKLEMSWGELALQLDHGAISLDHPGPAHEKFIAQHPREAFIFLLTFLGYRFLDIQKELSISAQELEKIYYRLDKNNFVSYRNKDSIRRLIRPPFRWAESGAFSRKYFLPAAHLIFDQLVRVYPGFSGSFKADRPFVQLGETYLSQKSLARLKSDLWELVEKYREISRHEVKAGGINEVFPVSFLLVAEKFPLWKKIMWN